jgi:hypothetical protein
MTDLTTAQRLAAYRDELKAEGFSADLIGPWIGAAAPTCIDEVTVRRDLDGTSPVATLKIDMVPQVNPESIRRLGDELHWLIKSWRLAEGKGGDDA